MRILGCVKGGVVVIDRPNELPEGTIVEILALDLPGDDQGRPIDPASLIGDLAVDLGDPDLSTKVNGDEVARRMDSGDLMHRMLDMAGPAGIPDLAANLDHYLYGYPKAVNISEGVPLADQGRPSNPASLIGDPSSDPTSYGRGDEIEEDASDSPVISRSLLFRMLDLAGPAGMPDLSTNLDHYLYGHPKVDDE